MDLQPQALTQSVGERVKNHKGDKIGKIEDIKLDDERKRVEYLVLCCSKLFGSGKRYFAIPASPSLIDVTDGDEVVIHTDKENLQIAHGVHADKCPKVDPEINESIFELFEYERSMGEQKKL